MPYIYLVVWSGGYDTPQYELKRTEEAAVKLANEWSEAADLEEGDVIDILRLDLVGLTLDTIQY